MRLRFAIRDQFTLPDITHFLATRALHSKAAGGYWRKTGGFALAPQTMLLRQCSGFGNTVGAVEPEVHQKERIRPLSDPASIHPRYAAWYKMG